MKADISTNDFIHIQMATRLLDLLFDELPKIKLDNAPLSARRIHLTALEHAAAICALAAWRFCLSRILKAGPGPWSYQI